MKSHPKTAAGWTSLGFSPSLRSSARCGSPSSASDAAQLELPPSLQQPLCLGSTALLRLGDQEIHGTCESHGKKVEFYWILWDFMGFFGCKNGAES